jgi:hypothetical protein
MQTSCHVLYSLAVSTLRGLACCLSVWRLVGAVWGTCSLVLPGRRRVTLDNLALAFGTDKTAVERCDCTRHVSSARPASGRFGQVPAATRALRRCAVEASNTSKHCSSAAGAC